MPRLPKYTSFAALQQNTPFLLDGTLTKAGDDVVLQSGQTAPAAPTYRVLAGTVVVKRTSTGEFVMADDANADTGSAASITTSSHSDGNGVIKIVGKHGTISVTTTTGTGTEANNATDLNADADFAAHYTASSAGGELTIASNAADATEWFYVHSDTMATAGFAEGVANGVNGADPDVRVTASIGELQDSEGNAVDALVSTITAGNFDTSELDSLTAEAKAVLIRNGSKFD